MKPTVTLPCLLLAVIGVSVLQARASHAVPAFARREEAKCQMCHGEKGMADSAAGKSMKVKPVTDADVKKMTEAQMVEAVENGMGKMQAYKGKLTDAQIKDVVGYFRTFVK